VVQYLAETVEGVPTRNHRLGYHHQYKEVVNRLEPYSNYTKIYETQRYNHHRRDGKDDVPDF
jgi:hypothetical protein